MTTKNQPAGPAAPAPLWRLFLKFLAGFNGGVVVISPPYGPEREKEGYYQRIKAIDEILADRPRVYVDHIFPSPDLPVWEELDHSTRVLRISGGFFRKSLMRLAVWLLVIRGRNFYFHATTQMNLNRLGWLFHWPFARGFLDVHGAVSEEYRMFRDYYHALLFEKWEKLAVKKAHRLILVTEVMGAYLDQKYRSARRASFIYLPILSELEIEAGPRTLRNGRPQVIYAGGLEVWQQADLVLKQMAATADRCCHRFYCPKPERIAAGLPAELIGDNFDFGTKSHQERLDILPRCSFGFITRRDDIVNNVACPTKLVEYLARGVVPIMDSPRVGDFEALGLKYVTLEDWVKGHWPEGRALEEMRLANVEVFRALQGRYHQGKAALRSSLSG